MLRSLTPTEKKNENDNILKVEETEESDYDTLPEYPILTDQKEKVTQEFKNPLQMEIYPNYACSPSKKETESVEINQTNSKTQIQENDTDSDSDVETNFKVHTFFNSHIPRYNNFSSIADKIHFFQNLSSIKPLNK